MKQKSTILVIGDWFVDENWLVSKHNTYSSSHVGHFHYLSKHTEVDKRMISLCGASEILEVLRQHFKEDRRFDIIGYGSWNMMDNDILQCTLCSDHTDKKHLTPYTIHSLYPVETENGRRVCPYKRRNNETVSGQHGTELGDRPETGDPEQENHFCTYHPNLKNLSGSDKKASTNRIIRCYEGHGTGKPKLLYRFDWQLPIVGLDYTEFESLPEDVEAVIIEDHNKGVVTGKTISALIDALKNKLGDISNIRWYIRSKIQQPEWMTLLKENNAKIRLNVIDHKLATYTKGNRRWLMNRQLGRASLELLGELTGDRIWVHGTPVPDMKIEPEHHTQRAAVIFDDNTLISKDGNTCFFTDMALGSEQMITIGRTTMFFVSLIAQDLSDEPQGDFGRQCYLALQCGYEWSKKASDAWSRENLTLYGDYKDALKTISMVPGYERETQQVKHVGYDSAWTDWNESSQERGILINENQTKRFEMWRGEGILKNYICVGGPKRNKINELVNRIARFNSESRPIHPFNCLLVSSPGWGKSYLAKCIAKHFDMNYLEFSVAQMATTKDLIDCFDTICSFQGRTQGKTLIFVDEVNSEIEGNPAMGLLLSPIWDGSFYKDGKTYQLSPSVWMFASTSPITDIINPGPDKVINKGSDFVSRLNGPIIELDTPERKQSKIIDLIKMLKRDLVTGQPVDIPYEDIMTNLPGYIKTEHVYLGVSLLNNFWGPISKIQIDVLQLLFEIVPINGFRSLEFYISKCQNIQRGAVVCSNMPSLEDFSELSRHVALPADWRGKRPPDKSPDSPEDKNDFVEVYTLFE